MAVSSPENEKEPIRSAAAEEAEDDDSEEFDEEEEDDDDDDDEELETLGEDAGIPMDRARMESLVRQFSRQGIPVRVHSVLIKGNAKTKDSLIEAKLEVLKSASTVQELLQAASIANARLQQLEIFDSVNITLDAGPPEIPGTATVVVEVAENENFLTGNIAIFSKPEVLLESIFTFL